MTVYVEQGQSLLDIVIQYGGDIQDLLPFAKANGIGITEMLVPGVSLQTISATRQDIVNYLVQKGIIPATNDDYTNNGAGIGYWILESDFVTQ